MSIQQAAVVDVGTPAGGFQGWVTTEVRYHGFADLTMAKGHWVASPEFACCGHQWQLAIYPGGAGNSDDGMAAVCLCHMSAKSIKLDFGFYVKGSDGEDVTHCCEGFDGSDLFEPEGTPPDKDRGGDANVAERSDLLGALVAGTLVLEVRMKCADSNVDTPPFVAEKSWNDRVRNMFLDEESADVMFEVGGDGQRHPESKKRSRTAPVKFHAHKLILEQSAPMLAALCPPGDGVAIASITDVVPEVFRSLLHYLYCGEVSEGDYQSHARQIILAADRFEIVDLKLAAEAWYVRSTKINLDNVMELLLYSDAKNLALLKEAVMDFIVDHGKDVLKKVPLNKVPAGLFADLLAAMTREKEKAAGDTGIEDLSSMRISDLRRKLHEKGLGIDGSREMLIAALERNN